MCSDLLLLPNQPLATLIRNRNNMVSIIARISTILGYLNAHPTTKYMGNYIASLNTQLQENTTLQQTPQIAQKETALRKFDPTAHPM